MQDEPPPTKPELSFRERIKSLSMETALELLKEDYSNDPRFKNKPPSQEFLEAVYWSIHTNET